jgi:hypothetical protein
MFYVYLKPFNFLAVRTKWIFFFLFVDWQTAFFLQDFTALASAVLLGSLR